VNDHAAIPPTHRVLRGRRFLEDTLKTRTPEDVEHNQAVAELIAALAAEHTDAEYTRENGQD
jgi:hypothetical protein